MNKKAVANALLDIQALGFSPSKPIRFKSGILSPVYVDNRRLPFHPEQWHIVLQAFQEVVSPLHVDVIAGVAVGGVPHSATLGYLLKKPSIFIRKEAKEYGKQQRIEGGDVSGLQVILVEDLVTTGASSLSAIDSLRQANAQVKHVCAIVSYGFTQTQAKFTEEGLTLHTLTDFATILTCASERNLLNEEEFSLVKDWLSTPHGWAERHGIRDDS